jgi:hypothetical protein
VLIFKDIYLGSKRSLTKLLAPVTVFPRILFAGSNLSAAATFAIANLAGLEPIFRLIVSG